MVYTKALFSDTHLETRSHTDEEEEGGSAAVSTTTFLTGWGTDDSLDMMTLFF